MVILWYAMLSNALGTVLILEEELKERSKWSLIVFHYLQRVVNNVMLTLACLLKRQSKPLTL